MSGLHVYLRRRAIAIVCMHAWIAFFLDSNSSIHSSLPNYHNEILMLYDLKHYLLNTQIFSLSLTNDLWYWYNFEYLIGQISYDKYKHTNLFHEFYTQNNGSNIKSQRFLVLLIIMVFIEFFRINSLIIWYSCANAAAVNRNRTPATNAPSDLDLFRFLSCTGSDDTLILLSAHKTIHNTEPLV